MKALTRDELVAADPHDLVPIREAARLLDVHPNTVRKWVHDDKLATVVVAGLHHVLIPHASDVEHQTRNSTRGRPRGVTSL